MGLVHHPNNTARDGHRPGLEPEVLRGDLVEIEFDEKACGNKVTVPGGFGRPTQKAAVWCTGTPHALCASRPRGRRVRERISFNAIRQATVLTPIADRGFAPTRTISTRALRMIAGDALDGWPVSNGG